MDMQIFSNEMTKFDKRFKGGKQLANDTLNEYYDLLSKIPNQPFMDICRQIRYFNRNYPTPGELKLAWGAWQKDNPDRIIDRSTQTDCDECEGDGFLEYYKTPAWIKNIGLDVEYLYTAKCPFCNNHGFAKYIPKLSKEDIEKLGYRLREKWKPKGGEIIRDREELIEKAFHEQDEIPF